MVTSHEDKKKSGDPAKIDLIQLSPYLTSVPTTHTALYVSCESLFECVCGQITSSSIELGLNHREVVFLGNTAAVKP